MKSKGKTTLVYIANARLPTEKAHGYQICKMCEAFAENGVNVHLFHPHRNQPDPSLQQIDVFSYYGIQQVFNVRTLPNRDVLLLERLLPKPVFVIFFFVHALLWGRFAARASRKENADIYYTREITVAFWLVLFGLPTVYEAHVAPGRLERPFFSYIAQRKCLQRVVVLAHETKEKMLGCGCPADKIIVCYHGADVSSFQKAPAKAECRQRLQLPQDRRIVGYVGRFKTGNMEKGISELVHAMALVKTKGGAPTLLLCVGGPLDDVPHYYRSAQDKGLPADDMRFVDRVPNNEVPQWMRACDVVVLPLQPAFAQKTGVMPLKLFEYMAAGVPIVAPDLPSIREILTHGQNAWLVEPGNPAALAAGIKKVMLDSVTAARISQAAQARSAQYTWHGRAAEVVKRLS